ncbi:MAG TPA: TonB-dependent receptor [Bryobacteraceae bacterium]|nr:TonB-dependent receptor [Bryobacteraceae bacterium]
MNKKSVLAALLLLCLPAGLLAQAVAGFGGISGVVRDATGAVVPSANVIVENTSKGIRRTLTSNDAGIFAAPALVPAPGYSVKVNKTGFTDFEVKEIEVLVGQNVNINVPLGVAGTATQVDISDAAPIVEQTKTGISQVVNSKQIQELPINGRRVDAFALLTPAVVADGAFGLVSFRGIAGGNAFLTDGNDTTNNFYNENAGRTRITTQISQDAVQEFQVLTNGYSAEFGRASGGVINTVTRSGGNNVHGTAYWFFRNQDFNARDPYATVNPEERRDQFGGSLGGPIKKDKLFYFVNLEATRRNFPLVASLTRPPLFDGNGAFVGTCGATAAQCQAAQNFLQRQFQVLDRTANSELGFSKIDWRPNERNAVSLSFNYLRWISPNGIQTQAVLNNGNGVGNNADSTVRTRYGRASWTFIPTNTVVNELRYGWFKDRLYDSVNASLIPALTGSVQITVQGQTNLGVADAYPRLNPSENKNQIADNLTWTVGKHTIKFGGDFVNARDYNNILRNQNGTYVYPTFTAFAQDLTDNPSGTKRWTSYSQRFGQPVVDTTIRDISFYAQDQYRITQKLTINYGLRYEYQWFTQPRIVNPDYAAQTGHIPSYGKNFAPRIGFAYAMNNNKTVLRAGYGIFYARTPGGLINTLHLENGVVQKQISLNSAVPADLAIGPVFPNKLAGIDRNPPAGTIDISVPDANLRNPYTQQGDVGIEHEITRDLGITASYLWSRGVQLYTVRDLNVGAMGPNVTYRINDASGNQVGTYSTPSYLLANRIDTRWRSVNQIENGGRSYYDAMVLQMRKRFSQMWEGSIAYTWSHAIDLNQGGGNDNIFYSGRPRSLVNGDYRQDKSSSSLDQRHRFVGTAIFTPVFTKKTDWFSKFIVNGWQLSNIFTGASSQPQTPTIFVSGNPFAGAAFNTSLNGFGGSTRVPFLPAASLDIDTIVRLDSRLSKILAITERYQLFLNFEAFNVFNHVSNTSVNGQAYQATNGVLSVTPRLGEGSASQGFPDGTNARRAQFSVRFVF